MVQPCEEPNIVSNILLQDGLNPSLRVLYTRETYQEIVNTRDVGVETCWSGIGGFIGIFVGYSLMQVPEIISNIWKLITQNSRAGIGNLFDRTGTFIA